MRGSAAQRYFYIDFLAVREAPLRGAKFIAAKARRRCALKRSAAARRLPPLALLRSAGGGRLQHSTLCKRIGGVLISGEGCEVVLGVWEWRGRNIGV